MDQAPILAGGDGFDDDPPPEPREGWLLVRVHVPELNVFKCLQFPSDRLIWDVKQQVLASLPKVYISIFLKLMYAFFFFFFVFIIYSFILICTLTFTRIHRECVRDDLQTTKQTYKFPSIQYTGKCEPFQTKY